MRPLSLVAAVAACLAVAACEAGEDAPIAPGPPASAPVSVPASPSPTVRDAVQVENLPALLALMRTEGGMCPDGPCEGELKVYTDGTYRVLDAGEWTHGTFPDTTLFMLREAIERADLLDRRKPQQTCSSWVDGQDLIVSYQATPARRVTASSCDYDFGGDPLVSALTHLHEVAVDGTPGKWPTGQ